MANVVTAALGALGEVSPPFPPATAAGRPAFNITLTGPFTATVALERSFGASGAWVPVTYPDGTGVQFTSPVSTTWEEPEENVLYRVRCAAFTAGPINVRLSQ